ncbi:killer toxin alpha/beta, partial [Microdochium trichocladiopsis]
FYSDLHPCPRSCQGTAPGDWDVFPSFGRLKLCPEPQLFDFNIHSDLDNPDPEALFRFRACTSGDAETEENALFEARRQTSENAESQCVIGQPAQAQVSITTEHQGLGSTNPVADVIFEKLKSYFEDSLHCRQTVTFAYLNGTVVGLYTGAEIGKPSSISAVLDEIAQHPALNDGVTTRITAEICEEDRNSHHVLGVFIDTTGDVLAAQKALQRWDDRDCQSRHGGSVPWKSPITIFETPLDAVLSEPALANGTPRATCSTTSAVSGDQCKHLAARCGITIAQLESFNPFTDFCTTLKAGQPVCCTAGDLPDFKRKADSDGTCATHLVQQGDFCVKIALANGITQTQLESYNKGSDKTWGWTSCENLPVGINICVSEGKPPLPAPVSNAVCGPTKPGVSQPLAGQSLADLAPCPLNICCNVWGQCGMTPDFCKFTDSKIPANPGTSPGGNSPCISNCGTDIVTDGSAPAAFGRVGYYESWNFGRSCLHLRASNANVGEKYTIIHWAFLELNSDYTVKIADEYGQWDEFVALTSAKRVVSFGGWAFSNDPPTYDVLRQAMSPANRDTFANSIVQFLDKYKLDGVDFDWEYPGATDIPGTPPGLATDGATYLRFLQLMRQKLPRTTGKTLSIAAPASYWYLKQFPIKLMAASLDYVVYMTYDLHGQWDAGNQWSAEGCPAGNCLRSHVNITETYLALSMITKAGVSPSKIFVGESSYGRSFRMATMGCTGPMCTFTGDRMDSQAAPGMCTDTAGYISNAEIEHIQKTYSKVQSFHDSPSNTDILVYDDLEWVAYMTETTKSTRRNFWKGFGFAGTIDWAVDLQHFNGDSLDDSINEWELDVGMPAKCGGFYTKLEDIEHNLGNIPIHCRSQHILTAMHSLLENTVSEFDELLRNGYEDSFNTYADVVVEGSRGAVQDFMYKNGNRYFTCLMTETVDDCYHCHWRTGAGTPGCRYCQDYDCGWSLLCNQPDVQCSGHKWRFVDMSQPCPPDYSQRGSEAPNGGEHWPQAVRWTLRASQSKAFWKDLYDEVGVDQKNIKWETIQHYGCAPTDEDCGKRYHDYNFPVPDGFTRDEVLDPKDLVYEARGKLNYLGPALSKVLQTISDGRWAGDLDDLVDALVIPVAMIEDAINNMKQIKKFAEDLNAQKRKMIILAFISALLFFLPVVGEVIATVGALANVGRILSLIGALGSIGNDIYSLVDEGHPDFFTIFGLVLAPLDIIDLVRMSKAAQIRRGMDPEDIKKLG